MYAVSASSSWQRSSWNSRTRAPNPTWAMCCSLLPPRRHKVGAARSQSLLVRASISISRHRSRRRRHLRRPRDASSCSPSSASCPSRSRTRCSSGSLGGSRARAAASRPHSATSSSRSVSRACDASACVACVACERRCTCAPGGASRRASDSSSRAFSSTCSSAHSSSRSSPGNSVRVHQPPHILQSLHSSLRLFAFKESNINGITALSVHKILPIILFN